MRSLPVVRDRAKECALSEEGLVLIYKIVPEGVPVIPPVAVQDDLPDGMLGEARDRAMTWRDWLVAQAHEPLPGQHLSAKRMIAALELVAWWDSMKVDAEKWVKSCRICAARLNKPRTSQPLKSLSS